jgi:preprotein translocase subunit SecG
VSIANVGVFAVTPPGWVPPVLAVLLLLVGLFLILLVLIQRGKGGGLAGAFGGVGGSSAFGSRAGDTFTRITIYVAAAWVLLIMILIKTTQWPAEAPSTPAITNPTAPVTTPENPQNPPAEPPSGPSS